MPLPEDTILENRYRIDGILAFGGMSAVYKAYDTNLQVPVAIKENYFYSAEAIEQFLTEALILARLRHIALPNVVQHFSFDGKQYLAMEFIAGLNLWEQVKEQGKPFVETEAVRHVAHARADAAGVASDRVAKNSSVAIARAQQT